MRRVPDWFDRVISGIEGVAVVALTPVALVPGGPAILTSFVVAPIPPDHAWAMARLCEISVKNR